MGNDLSERIAARKAEKAQLRARARKVGMTIRSNRGTGTGYYSLHRGERFGSIGCHGLEEVANWLAWIEQALAEAGVTAKPTAEQLTAGVRVAHQMHAAKCAAERESATPATCEFCQQPREGESVWGVGPEDGYQWVHRRCYAGFVERNRRWLEEQGYVGGVKLTVLRA